MKRILFVGANHWDMLQLAAGSAWRTPYDLIFTGTGAEDAPERFQAVKFVDRTVAEYRSAGLSGVASASDYPGCLVAAAIAHELELPGPSPAAVLRCAHKYYSRLVQREAVPEATPAFALVDPREQACRPAGLPFPLFVKPVKSWFTQHARRVADSSALRAFAHSAPVIEHLTSFVAPFNQLLARYTDFEYDGSYLLAESCLGGEQVTLEGFVQHGRVTVTSIVDSVMYPGTISFERFEYPSSLPAGVQDRMADIARRVMPATGFDDGLFNIELFYEPASNRVSIIEINPRMCGQFADLMEMVNGTNTYAVLLAVSAGETPAVADRAGRFAVAASFALRSFEDRRVVRVPDDEDIQRVRRAFPVSQVQVFYRAGQRLSDENQSDGYSYRYALVNMAGASREALLADFERVRAGLDFRFEAP